MNLVLLHLLVVGFACNTIDDALGNFVHFKMLLRPVDEPLRLRRDGWLIPRPEEVPRLRSRNLEEIHSLELTESELGSLQESGEFYKTQLSELLGY